MEDFGFVRDISAFGGTPFYFLLLVLILFSGDYVLLFRLSLCYFIAVSFSFLIRIFYFKERPEKKKYHNFIEKLDAATFPSIHSARAGILSYAFYFRNPSVLSALLSLVFLIIVVYSRIYLKKHFLKDTIAGAMLGFAVSFFVFS